jgi:hypothetical protein
MISEYPLQCTISQTEEGIVKLPESGTIIRVFTSIEPSAEDEYFFTPAEALLPLPKSLTVYNNFPNPFNPATALKFYLPGKSSVKVTVFNILGEEVSVILDDILGTGEHYAIWGGRTSSGVQASTGVYIYRIATDESICTGKMILLR